jgi:hypothetical protein
VGTRNRCAARWPRSPTFFRYPADHFGRSEQPPGQVSGSSSYVIIGQNLGGNAPRSVVLPSTGADLPRCGPVRVRLLSSLSPAGPPRPVMRRGAQFRVGMAQPIGDDPARPSSAVRDQAHDPTGADASSARPPARIGTAKTIFAPLPTRPRPGGPVNHNGAFIVYRTNGAPQYACGIQGAVPSN